MEETGSCSGQWACTEPGAHSPAGWCGVCMHSNFTGRCRLAMVGRQCEEELKSLLMKVKEESEKVETWLVDFKCMD